MYSQIEEMDFNIQALSTKDSSKKPEGVSFLFGHHQN